MRSCMAISSLNKKFLNDKEYSSVEIDTTNVQKLIQFITINNLSKMIKERNWITVRYTIR